MCVYENQQILILQRAAYHQESTKGRENWMHQVSHSVKQPRERQTGSLKLLSETQRSSNLLAWCSAEVCVTSAIKFKKMDLTGAAAENECTGVTYEAGQHHERRLQ